MAQPLKAAPILKGKAAKKFADSLKATKPDASKQKKIKKALATHRKLKVVA